MPDPDQTPSKHSLDVSGALRRVAGGTAIATIAPRAFGFLSQMVVARFGGATIYGEYLLVISTAGMIADYAAMGASQTATRFVGKYPVSSPSALKVLRHVILLGLATSTIAFFVIFMGADVIAEYILARPDMSPYFKIGAASAFGLLLFGVISSTTLAMLEHKKYAIFNVITSFFLFLSLSAVVTYGVEAMVTANAIVYVGAAALGGVVFGYWRAIYRNQGSVPEPRSVDLLFFGLSQLSLNFSYGIVTWLVMVLISRSDVTLHETAYYGIASQLKSFASTLPVIFSLTFFPLLNRYGQKDQHAENTVVRTTSRASAAAVLIPGQMLVIFMPMILSLYGNEFLQASKLSALLVLCAIIQFAAIPSVLLLTAKRLGLATLLSQIGSLSILLVAFLLVPQAGALGAGYAFLFGFLLSTSSGLLALYILHLFDVTSITIWLTSVISSVLILSLGWSTTLDDGFVHYGIASIQVTILLMAVWILTLLPSEKNLR